METKLERLEKALRDVEVAIARHTYDDENNVMSDLLHLQAILLQDIEKEKQDGQQEV